MLFLINVEGAICKENKWLVIERSLKEAHAGGLLSLVGGTVDQEGDSKDLLERTLKREMYEEVGITVKNLKYVRNTSFVIDNGREVIDIVFLCEIDAGEPFAKSPDEVESVFWMTAEEIFHHEKAPIWLKESIREADAIREKTFQKGLS